MISYQAPMLPDVNYALLDEDAYFSLTDLEYDTMKSCSHFLEELKWVLIEEKLVQIPQILCGYLCAYLGTITTVHTVKKAEALVDYKKAIELDQNYSEAKKSLSRLEKQYN